MSYTQEQVDVMNAEQDARDQLKAHIDSVCQRVGTSVNHPTAVTQLKPSELLKLMQACGCICYVVLGGTAAMEALSNDRALSNDGALIKCVSARGSDSTSLGYIGDIFGAPIYVPTAVNHMHTNLDPRSLYVVAKDFSAVIAKRLV